MDWLEVSVQVDGEAAEAVSEVLNRYGRGGVVIEHLLTDGKTSLCARGIIIDIPNNSIAVGDRADSKAPTRIYTLPFQGNSTR